MIGKLYDFEQIEIFKGPKQPLMGQIQWQD